MGILIQGINLPVDTHKPITTMEGDYITLRIFPDGKVYDCKCFGFFGDRIVNMKLLDKKAIEANPSEDTD